MKYLFFRFLCISILSCFFLFGENENLQTSVWQEIHHDHKQEVFSDNVPAWMMEQIQYDLSPFADSGIKQSDLDDLMQSQEKNCNSYFLVRYKILNQQINAIHYPTDHPGVLSRINMVTAALTKLTSIVQLPDIDFIITMLDSLDGTHLSVPVFAFANDPNCSSKIVLIPDFEALTGNEHLLYQVKIGNALYPWKSKLNRVIWRGSMTGYPYIEPFDSSMITIPRMGGIFSLKNFLDFPRTRAITISLQYPDKIDARYTTLSQCIDCNRIRSQFSEYFGHHMSIDQHLSYKYQLLIDGNTCAYSRAYWQLFSNSVILKQNTNALQWYSRAIRPWVHYLPIQSDLSDLVEVVDWAIYHEEQTKKISIEAQNFAQKNLTHFHVMQYLYLLLIEYAKLYRR